jgi:uncharacterized YigZ family protein
MEDTYLTIEKPTKPILFKNKNSKFYSYAFPVLNEEMVKQNIDCLKTAHKKANHWCYAYKLGVENIQYRINDDGEPNNSAGMPIYGQIQSFNLTNVLVVVVRYFGGVKLGASGLINAYKSAAQLALAGALIIKKTINQRYGLNFEYKNINTVMRIMKEFELNILKQDFNQQCYLEFEVRKRDSEKVESVFKSQIALKKIPIID